ncbi:MAG: hypothetical protein K2Y32_05645 [Candidatus Obscuribacterales bacterium]|nr:hypothetical protein [Candidatus Obscuribacterales bacterium]
MENGVFISSNWFGKIVRIAQATALNIYHLLMYSIDLEFKPESQNIRSRDFLPHFIKRSIWSIRGLHPGSEESVLEQENSHSSKDDSTQFEKETSDNFEERQPVKNSDNSNIAELTWMTNCSSSTLNKEPQHQRILDCLAEAGALHPDELSAKAELEIAKLNESLTDLELAGLIKMTFGGRVELALSAPESYRGRGNHCLDELDPCQTERESQLRTTEPSKTRRNKSSLRNNFDRLIRREFHGISRKYLQLYLSFAKLLIFSNTSPKEPAIIEACLKTGDLEMKKLKLYQTPVFLTFPRSAEA